MRDLVFDRISVVYGRTAALTDLSLRCPAGRVTCMVGPNGAGKSTALAVAAGITTAGCGRILMGSREVKWNEPVSCRSYLPQDAKFPKMLKVNEVVAFAAAITRTSETELDDALNVTGVREVFDRPIGELSGGWERRVGLAWALLQPAEVLILDEPLAGLDPETLDRVIDCLSHRAARGHTILMATHDFEAVERLRPSVAVLDRGILIARFENEPAPLRERYRVALLAASLNADVSAE